jgi:methylenetetrahydrofolate reductase (NADPH)
MRKYGASITKLLSTAGPELILRDLEAGLAPHAHGQSSLHFYPFGGFARTAEWARRH